MKTRAQKETLKEKMVDGGIDAGLFLLSLATPYGVTRTLEEIAEVCGCSRENIRHIEERALAKLGKGLRAQALLRAWDNRVSENRESNC